MNDILKLMRTGASSNEVLMALAKTSHDDLESVAQKMDDKDFAVFGTWISATCRAAHIQKTLIFGGLIHFYLTATECQNRKEAFDNLLVDLGISLTQAYRCRDAWLQFGCVFLEEPSLRKHFVAESVKLLSEPRATDDAREEAVRRARRGERISIALAKKILSKSSKSSPGGAPTKQNKMKSNSRSSVKKPQWKFEGQVTQIIVKPSMADTMEDVNAVIKDLEDAIAALSQAAFAAA